MPEFSLNIHSILATLKDVFALKNEENEYAETSLDELDDWDEWETEVI